MVKEVELKEVREQTVDSEHPPYEPPQVVTYHDDDLLAELGPAQACSYVGSVVGCPAPPWEDPWQVP
jgi:hypothetical protein